MKKTVLFLIGLFVFIYILPLGLRPLVDPDETRYAEIPREMIASGDWVVPRLDGVVYFEKPVFGYWVNALSIKVFGENPFAVRFPLALSALLTAGFVFFLAGRLSENRYLAFPSALAFITCLEVFAIGVFNTLDSLLSFFLTGTLTMFFLAWKNRDSARHYLLYLFLSGIFCGFACMTKGFLAFAVPVAVIVPFLVWEGQWKKIFTIPWIPVATALLVMLPWGIMIHLREPEFWYHFFWNEHIRRFLSHNAQHNEPFYYFLVVFILGIFPWTIQVPAAVSGLWSTGFRKPLRRFAVCWLVFPFLFFSASSGKLATYILPCFPPFALLLAWGIADYFQKGRQQLFNRSALILLLFPIAAVTAALLLQHGISHKMDELFDDNRKILLFLAAMAQFAVCLIMSARTHDPYRKFIWFALAPVLFYASAHVMTPDKALLRNSPVPFILENKHRIDDNAIIVSPSTPIKAICWALKRDDIFLLDGGGELRYGFSRDDQKHRQLSFEDFRSLVRKNKGTRQIILILDERRFNRWKDSLPEPDLSVKNGEDGFIFAQF